MSSEVGHKADFSQIRYAQCWEDADILLSALQIQPQHQVLSIASAGDNTLSLLSQGPARVVALDLSAAQLACLALRIAAYRTLDHSALLELIGAKPSARRALLYAECRPLLDKTDQTFWDTRPQAISRGIGTIGKFERYLRLFGRRILPLLQARSTRTALFQPRAYDDRVHFYERRWNHWWWRAIFRFFFSRRVMGWLGRDPSFFTYVEGQVGERLLARVRHALVEMDPTQNPYLQWIVLARYDTALPHALRAENFSAIRKNLDRLEWHCNSVEGYLQEHSQARFDRYNLSDIFEYMSLPNYHALLETLVTASNPGGRLAYWNMMAPRRRPMSMADRLASQTAQSSVLYAQDKAFFYSDFVIEDIL
jgi:S-adenosylmethionine-diacylglycerol 3-amino-3-carboxypropyl transferase